MTALELQHLSVEQADKLPALLRALWHDAQGNWAASHETAQDIVSREGAWVHAYLHRKEGDAPNAAYWYRRAGRPVVQGSFEGEWDAIATELLSA